MLRQWTILIAVTFAAAANSASDSLDVKTGLWEMTYTTSTEGTLIPQSALDKLPPEQRAKVAAAVKERSAKGPRTFVEKTCVTAADLSQGAFRSDQDKDSNCKFTTGAHTSSVQEETVVCAGEDARRGNFKVEALGRDRIKAAYNGEAQSGKISMQMTGRWLSASCAGADDE